ncbi:hypothetical protein DPEC_G00323040 [Dallia pectoralis]|uniref:Uncharacterized protein n=1 Tax=Dallia pectoralis TaxID=75939 RepID=A0ACC2FAM1_DALPE|nr:hypothetical protein DPEC_G00323040 [Dallia pectoralis]
MKEQPWLSPALEILLVVLCLASTCSGRPWAQRKVPCDVPSVNHSLAFDCSHRKLHFVPRDISRNAIELNLSFNKIKKISSLSFLNYPNLTSLDLSNNKFESSTKGDQIFSILGQLRTLILDGNILSAVPRPLPSSLQILFLRFNALRILSHHDFEDIPHVKVLNLKYNCYYKYRCDSLEIHNHTFSNLRELTNLTLSFNRLQAIPPFLPESLKKLNLEHNMIAHIRQHDLSKLTNLITLKLSGNCPLCSTAPFPCVSCETPNNALHIHKDAFGKLFKLQELRLSGNSLEHLETSLFENLTSLRYLYLSFNRLVSEIATGEFLYFLPKVETDLRLFRQFHNVSSIGLSENKLTFLPKRVDASSVCGCECGYEPNRDRFGPYIHMDKLYRQHLPNIKPECLAYGPVLDLSKNNIFSIKPNLPQGLDNTACINLSSNSIEDMLNGSEFVNYPGLKYLDLSQNKIYLRSPDAFSELQNLEVLDLSQNRHYFVVAGLNHSLGFLKHLVSLKVLNISWNEISNLCDKTLTSSSLQELVFQGNRLDILWIEYKQLPDLFEGLQNLTTLDLSYNKLSYIPSEVYEHFPLTLRRLSLSKNGLTGFDFNLLSKLPHLEELDLSKNKLDWVASNFSALTISLKVLDLSYNRISQLTPGFLRGTQSLTILDLSFNLLKLINQSLFESGAGNYLQQLSLQGNPLHCTCDLLYFHLWIRNNEVEIPLLATAVTCDMPADRRGKSVLSCDIDECMNDKNAMLISAVMSSLVILVLSVSLIAHRFYWDLSYILDYYRAKLKHYRRLLPAHCVYDAFIMYDTADPKVSDWVLNYLRVELEEEGEIICPLCLEERDWMPGTNIIDNLSNSVRKSRKTVFVLTEGFLSRGLVQIASLLVHQRLVEEGVDSMVLLLLQPQLFRRSRILHLRKRLCGRSVLEWPANASPDARRWFWYRLKSAIRKNRRAAHTFAAQD